jgi:hypothetical protein
MADFDLSARISLDASDVVRDGAEGERAIEGIGKASKDAAAGSRQLETASAAAAKAQATAATAATNNAKSLVDLARQEREAARAALDAARQRAQAEARATAPGRVTLTPSNPSVTLSPGSGTAARDVQQATAANEALAAAILRAEAAEARFEAASRSSATAVAAEAAAQDRLGASLGRTTAAAATLVGAEASAAAGAEELARAQNGAAAAAEAGAQSSARAASTVAAAQTRVQSATTGATRAHNENARAANDNAAAANRAAFGARNLGQQVGDFATQVSLGGSVVQAFSAQVGQAGFAMSEMGGKIGAVGRFLTGPWGVALTVASLVLAPFVSKLFEGGNAAEEQAKRLDQAAQAADSYGNVQSILGKIIDLQTGKIKTQNVALIQQIKLLAQANILKAQKERQTLQDGVRGFGEVTGGETFEDIGGAAASANPLLNFVNNALRRGQQIGPLKKVLEDYIQLTNTPGVSQTALDRGLVATTRALDGLSRAGRIGKRDLIDAKQAVLSLATNLNDEDANKLALRAANGEPLDPLLKPYKADPKAKKPPKPKKPKVDTTTPREAEDIQRINEEFDRTPTLIDRAAQATRKLDKIIADLSKRKPPGFEKLIADANAAKETIQTGLQRPYLDFIRDQQQALDVQKLLTAGRVDEANALKTVQSLQATMGPLTDAQKDAILATNQALRAEQRELDVVRAKNAKYVEALGSIKGIVEDATQAFVRGDLGQLIKSPGKILDAFQTLQGRKLFDGLFGDAFRDLEDQANGTSVVKDASARMASAVDKASASIAKLGSAAESAAGAVAGTPATGAAGGTTTNAEGDIIVTGKRDPIATALGRVGEKVAGLFTNPENAARIGQSIGKFAGKGLQGAATGSIVAGVGKALGVNLSQTGSQLGGAVGGILGGIKGVTSALGPLGAALTPALSVLGGIVGKLFGKTKTASAGVMISDGQVSAGAAKGTSSRLAGASGLAGSVSDGIANIAQQLGAQLTGSTNVKIGTYKDQIRVSTNGTPIGGKGSSGAITFKDEQSAVEYAIRDAISDGVFGGLSDAVVRALKGNADIDKAVSEALGVKALEAQLGGTKDAIKAVFDEEDKSAKERLRLARAYGLDVAAVEKLNAEQRTKLVDDTLKARVGSLSEFLNNLKFGDLAEGTAADKRSALLDQIKQVQKDAEAGKDGAADQLTSLYQQLVTNSRDAFGTAGPEFTTDRSNAQSGVERVIAMETDRVNQAAGITAAAAATTSAVQAGNQLTSETNDLLAQQTAELRATNALLAGRIGYGDNGAGTDYGITARQPNKFAFQ